MPTITIRSTDKSLTISSQEDIGGRKSYPSCSQKSVERQVKSIHETCKDAANYLGTTLYLDEIDYYEAVDSFQVPRASMRKGDRKVRDESDYSNTIPKDWEEHIIIKYKATTRNARPLGDALKALNVRGVDVKDIQKMLKKNNGFAYICGGKVSAEFEYDD